MLFRYLLISLAALLFVCPLAEAQTPESTTPAPPPKRQQVNSDVTPEEKADFDAAAASDQEGSISTALGGYRRFIKNHPASALAMKAQFRIAEIYEELGDSTKAFNSYQKLVTQ